MEHKRIAWVDAAKGIGIILVVLGHTMASPDLVKYIFSFHMPLFFFLSGYLFSIDKYPKFSNFLYHKFRTILIPYLVFSVISIVAFKVIVEGSIDISDAIFALIISKRNEIYYNVPLWFFTSLFLVQVMYYIIKKLLKKRTLIIITVFLLSSFSIYVLKTIEQPKLPWTADAALYYLLYYAIGNLVSNITIPKERIKRCLFYAIVLVSCALNGILLIVPQKLSGIYNLLSQYRLLEIIWYPLISLSGIIMTMLVSKHIENSKMLKFLGKNSLIIFSLHVPFGLCIIDKLMIIFNFTPNSYNVFGGMQTALILLILWPIINFINNHVPFVLGRKRSRDTV